MRQFVIPKAWTQSKTIWAALVWALTLLAGFGVKWAKPDDPRVQMVSDAVSAVVTVLGAAGVITFRVNADQPIGKVDDPPQIP